MKPQCRNLYTLVVVLCIGIIVLDGCGSGCETTPKGSSGGPGSGTSSSRNGSAGCDIGGGGDDGGVAPTTTAFLYYFGSANIQGASLNSAGTFANLSSFTPPAMPSNSANSMVIAKKQFLYIPTSGFANVQAFSINRTSGALAAISGSPFGAQAQDDTVTTDPTGRFLFVGGKQSAAISAYLIDATTGALTAAPGSPFRSFNLAFADSLTVDGTGKFLYVGQTFSANPVVVFAIDQSTGALTEITSSPFHLGVAVVQADPSGKFLLGIANSTGTSGDKHIHVFSIDSTTGALAPVANSPFATTSAPFALAVHPGGKFVYLSVADSGGTTTSFEGYQLNTTSGAITALSGSPFTTLPVVSNCQFEQSGAYAFCQRDNGFSVLSVNTSTGALSHTIPDLTTSNNFPFAVTN